MCGIFKHKTIVNIYLKVKQVTVMLWICGTDQNQTEWREKDPIFENCRWFYLWPKMAYKMSQEFPTVFLDITHLCQDMAQVDVTIKIITSLA